MRTDTNGMATEPVEEPMTDNAEFARLADDIELMGHDAMANEDLQTVIQALRFRANATEERIKDGLHLWRHDPRKSDLDIARAVLAALKGEGK